MRTLCDLHLTSSWAQGHPGHPPLLKACLGVGVGCQGEQGLSRDFVLDLCVTTDLSPAGVTLAGLPFLPEPFRCCVLISVRPVEGQAR